MGALGTLFTALAFFDTCQLFQFAMQLFNHPMHLVLFLNNLRVNGTWRSIGNHPVNVAVGGDDLEKLHFEENFLELNRDP